MSSDLSPSQTVFVVIVAAIILLAQSLYLFLDARKHGHNYWLWGIVGLIQAPFPTILYLLFVRKKFKKRRLKFNSRY
ncbi:sigma-Y antisigma factor component [Bacillus sp. T33-2]|uniref:sigma-Y antisigma factor component n=1 Tax=Bacillus sp. T33-2 TaxID=2054168 RepID=UPI000C760E64|nr:sigma-Y antisigma factor component [Bacillus sp. T33-2]PLR89929.1 sigma-Y antisigma factor component [Bacillus sp. T33-2]